MPHAQFLSGPTVIQCDVVIFGINVASSRTTIDLQIGKLMHRTMEGRKEEEEGRKGRERWRK